MIHYSILWTDSCVGKREDLRLILLGFDEDNGLHEGVCGCWVTLQAPLVEPVAGNPASLPLELIWLKSSGIFDRIQKCGGHFLLAPEK
jgi:hypothetical protein